MRPLTKYAHQIVNPNTIPSVVREAFRLAEEERPGAVHIELPEDIAAEYADSDRLFAPNAPFRPDCDSSALAAAIEKIGQAKHPLLLIGAGANRKNVVGPLEAFIEKTGIPFFNTQMGKGAIGGYHKGYIGTAVLSEGDYLHCAIRHADLFINAGHDVVEKPPFLMEGCNAGARLSVAQVARRGHPTMASHRNPAQSNSADAGRG